MKRLHRVFPVRIVEERQRIELDHLRLPVDLDIHFFLGLLLELDLFLGFGLLFDFRIRLNDDLLFLKGFLDRLLGFARFLFIPGELEWILLDPARHRLERLWLRRPFGDCLGLGYGDLDLRVISLQRRKHHDQTDTQSRQHDQPGGDQQIFFHDVLSLLNSFIDRRKDRGL